MPLSMYQASVPVFIRHLRNLSEILKKAVAHAEERAEAPSLLIEARLAPDMFPLARQIQSVSDTSKGAAARLAGVEVPSFPDTETTFDELQDRIRKTIAFLESVPAGKVEGSEDREVILRPRGNEMRFKGQDYLLDFALPNFFFHVTIAYAILREQGVPIGKMDYLGSF
ncbi:MAG TPA: DUF1993 domain-containing protein [Geminicoccus sp.]|uniref:DUF1993 domain-containing protein n=1 Tax=Geminicoccus sp. TaxID=2024832 RepID=UPI002E369CEA|nr:DUF1993 domain-containing protein [Geminicoccus sp.]HEX2529757.1 DUF1993 domain-containing protein [Geminicoccus sp.]